MKDVIIGIDAGTSVIKSVAFTLDGEQLALSSVPNDIQTQSDGVVEQDLDTTWSNTLKTLQGLAEQLTDLPERLAAIAVTGQGDGTWLIDKQGKAVCPGWLWLDARASEIVNERRGTDADQKRFQITGTGLNACQQSAQMLWMKRHANHLLEKSETAFHCKDWIYFKLTGQRFTDPSEGCFTFGDFRNRRYSDEVLECLDLKDQKRLLPPMLDGVDEAKPLSAEAASESGLFQGTPTILGYVDVINTALGAGLYDAVANTGCTVVGSTGMHMRLARTLDDVSLNADGTGYVMVMPIPGVTALMQSNMASTLNIDWLMDLAVGLIGDYKTNISRSDLIARIDEWVERTKPATVLYQPYISDAGERGPFINSDARAGFIGLSTKHQFGDLVRSVIEGLAFAARDCYQATGSVPGEVRLTGGAARSNAIRTIFGSVLGTKLRTTSRAEAGAAGAAMMAAVNIGHFDSMDDCVRQWVNPLLGPAESFDASLHAHYSSAFAHYVEARKLLPPVWHAQAHARKEPES